MSVQEPAGGWAKGDPRELFQLVEKLGEGSYGEVYTAIERATGQIYAVKIVPVDKEGGNLDALRSEIDILAMCSDCPYVIRYIGAWLTSEDCPVGESQLWIVMENAAGGSLAELISVADRALNEDEVAEVMVQTLQGLIYLHERGILHRDLKAGNILLTDLGEAKLSDFGVSAQVTSTLTKRKTMIGTPYWLAPEVITESGHDSRADIWSLGITAIELIDGAPPYSNVHPMRVLFMIPMQAPPVPLMKNLSREFLNFLSLCLQKNPKERPSASELLRHPFLDAARARAEEVKEEMELPLLLNYLDEWLPVLQAEREKEEEEQRAKDEEEEREDGEDDEEEEEEEDLAMDMNQMPKHMGVRFSQGGMTNKNFLPVQGSTTSSQLSDYNDKEVTKGKKSHLEDISTTLSSTSIASTIPTPGSATSRGPTLISLPQYLASLRTQPGSDTASTRSGNNFTTRLDSISDSEFAFSPASDGISDADSIVEADDTDSVSSVITTSSDDSVVRRSDEGEESAISGGSESISGKDGDDKATESGTRALPLYMQAFYRQREKERKEEERKRQRILRKQRERAGQSTSSLSSMSSTASLQGLSTTSTPPTTPKELEKSVGLTTDEEDVSADADVPLKEVDTPSFSPASVENEVQDKSTSGRKGCTKGRMGHEGVEQGSSTTPSYTTHTHGSGDSVVQDEVDGGDGFYESLKDLTSGVSSTNVEYKTAQATSAPCVSETDGSPSKGMYTANNADTGVFRDVIASQNLVAQTNSQD